MLRLAAHGVMKRNSRAKELIYSFRDLMDSGPQESAPELWNTFNSRKSQSGKPFVCSLFQIGPNWTFALHPRRKRFPIVPLYYAREREVVLRNGSIY